MIELSITADWGDGPQTAKTNGWTIIQWERKTKQKYSAVVQDGLGLEDTYLIAHIAFRDAQIVVPDFDKFCKQITTLEVAGEDLNPTEGVSSDTQ
jgi:hypothetical protein